MDTVLITGAAGGIGRALVRRLADRYRLVLVDRPESPLAEMAHEAGSDCLTIESDLSDFRSCWQTVERSGGRLYGFVHLAGVFEQDPALAADHGVWDRAIQHNLTNAYDMATAVAQSLIPDRMGRLVFTSSLAFRRGAVDHVAYSAAKGGLVGLVRALSRRLRDKALVNGLAPGIIDTAMPREIIAKRKDRLLAEIPLKRFGDASEIAAVIQFLLSEDASYITGQTINVDGGLING
ncbi:MAG: SDR family NAD(P)-dependent oxidoreductase [Geminicoccaceae bacterium]